MSLARQRAERVGLLVVAAEALERVVPATAPHRERALELLRDLGVATG